MDRVNELIESLRVKVSEYFSSDASGHSIDHLERVLKYALYLQSKEGGDIVVIAIASFVHDVHRIMQNETGKFVSPKDSLPKVKEILTKFDEIESIKDLDEEENGIKIHIGKDSELSEDVSIIKTKYNYNGEEGTIAIIGPKRMEYERVVNLLNYIKENIDEKNN